MNSIHDFFNERLLLLVMTGQDIFYVYDRQMLVLIILAYFMHKRGLQTKFEWCLLSGWCTIRSCAFDRWILEKCGMYVPSECSLDCYMDTPCYIVNWKLCHLSVTYSVYCLCCVVFISFSLSPSLVAFFFAVWMKFWKLLAHVSGVLHYWGVSMWPNS